jgi:hypothetical protein
MQARRCGGCGAPLPDTDDQERPTCRFCGLVHDPASAGGAPVRIAIDMTSARRTARGAVLIVSIVFLIAILAPLAFVYMQWRAADALTSASSRGSRATGVPKKAFTTRDLRDLPKGFHDLDTTAPPGGYGAVDAVATLPWALAIAQAWSEDARIDRIDVERMRPDGVVNAADDAEASVTYRFASTNRTAELRRRAQTSSRAELDTGFWVKLSRARTQAFADYNAASFARTDGATPAHPVALPLADLVARPGAKRALQPVPFYKGYMIYNQREGWVWYFMTLANETFPRLRARDGAAWPYRS